MWKWVRATHSSSSRNFVFAAFIARRGEFGMDRRPDVSRRTRLLVMAVTAATAALCTQLPARAGFVDWSGESLNSKNWLYAIAPVKPKNHPELVIPSAQAAK